eukprot:781373-Amphidinium_carterae.1
MEVEKSACAAHNFGHRTEGLLLRSQHHDMHYTVTAGKLIQRSAAPQEEEIGPAAALLMLDL